MRTYASSEQLGHMVEYAADNIIQYSNMHTLYTAVFELNMHIRVQYAYGTAL